MVWSKQNHLRDRKLDILLIQLGQFTKLPFFMTYSMYLSHKVNQDKEWVILETTILDEFLYPGQSSDLNFIKINL